MLLVILVNWMLTLKVSWVLRLFKPLVEKFEREENLERPGIQALYANLGVFLSYLLFGKTSLVGVLVLAVGDSLSTLVGKSFGKRGLFFNPSKSWEGTFSFFLGSYPVSLLFLGVEEAVVVCVVTALVESSKIKIDDNLTVPLTASALAYLM